MKDVGSAISATYMMPMEAVGSMSCKGKDVLVDGVKMLSLWKARLSDKTDLPRLANREPIDFQLRIDCWNRDFTE
jgi:hypothetical protein